MNTVIVTTLANLLVVSFLLSIRFGTTKLEIEWTDEQEQKSSQQSSNTDLPHNKDTGTKERLKPYKEIAENGVEVTVYPSGYWHTTEGEAQKSREAVEAKRQWDAHPAKSKDKAVRDAYWEQVREYGPN
jgi:hypothetical protein